MTAWVSIAIIILAIVVLILGAPFALNEYSRYQERQEQPITTVTSVITTPAINPDPNIFNTHWCRKEGVFRRCYQLFPDHSYSYGSDDTHAEVIMPDKWVLISQNKYLIPGSPANLFISGWSFVYFLESFLWSIDSGIKMDWFGSEHRNDAFL